MVKLLGGSELETTPTAQCDMMPPLTGGLRVEFAADEPRPPTRMPIGPAAAGGVVKAPASRRTSPEAIHGIYGSFVGRYQASGRSREGDIDAGRLWAVSGATRRGLWNVVARGTHHGEGKGGKLCAGCLGSRNGLRGSGRLVGQAV